MYPKTLLNTECIQNYCKTLNVSDFIVVAIGDLVPGQGYFPLIVLFQVILFSIDPFSTHRFGCFAVLTQVQPSQTGENT